MTAFMAQKKWDALYLKQTLQRGAVNGDVCKKKTICSAVLIHIDIPVMYAGSKKDGGQVCLS